MKKSDIKNSSDMFLYKAIVDLNSAKCLLAAFDNNEIEIDVEKIYFELQQSAEKILKSLLSRQNTIFPKCHDIGFLIDLCLETNIKLSDNVSILVELSDYTVDGRYSMIHDDINESEKYIITIENLIGIAKAMSEK